MLPAWIYVLAVLMVSTGYSFKKLYKTPQSREAVDSGIVHDPTGSRWAARCTAARSAR